ncbi:FliG C-terminal domain-containing protein [Shigella flexneri]
MFLSKTWSVDDRSIQRLLQEVDSGVPAIALKGASRCARSSLRNMSQRVADILLVMTSPTRPGAFVSGGIMNRKPSCLSVLRRLAELGEMVIGSGDDTYV